jgi:NTE family protein
MYVVMDGEVEFLAREVNGWERRLGAGGAGAMFGEVTAFSGLARSATARAIGETMVLRLPREAALEMLRTSPEFTLRIVQTLGQRLRDATLAEPVVAGSATASPARRAFSLDDAVARLGVGTVRS